MEVKLGMVCLNAAKAQFYFRNKEAHLGLGLMQLRKKKGQRTAEKTPTAFQFTNLVPLLQKHKFYLAKQGHEGKTSVA